MASGPAFAREIADAVSIAIPAAAKTTAAPNATKPTAPAVNVGATIFATIKRPAIAATIPTKTPIAKGPASETLIAASDNTQNAALIIKILPPSANIAVDIAVSFFVPPDIAESIFIIPILSPIKAPTIPTKTATAKGPESATAFAP